MKHLLFLTKEVFPKSLKKVADQFPWFVSRMMMDTWFFGLLVTGNLVIVVERINRIREHGGIVWLDVEMSPRNESLETRSATFTPSGLRLMFSPTDRTQASIRADAVIAAFELADT